MVLILFLLLFSAPSFAQRPWAHRPDTSILRAQSPQAQPTSAFSGTMEIRPTLGTRKGNFTTENYYELGLGMAQNERLSLGGMVFTASGNSGNQETTLGDGYLRYQWREIKKNPVTGLTVSTEVRLGLPLSQLSRDAGLISALRGSVIFAVPITTHTRFEFRETPIVYLYKDAGHEGSQGVVAHPLFENRVFLGPIMKLNEQLTLTTPICFSVTRYRNYTAGANRNNQWIPDLSFNPELDWAVNSNLYLGAAYRTEGFMVKQDSGVVLGDGAGNGSLQFILGTSF